MKVSGREREYHRKAAAKSFNKAWDYLDKKDRTSEEDLRMLQEAHASRYHWDLVGTAENRAVGDWQISRAYAALGQADLALRFAESALSTCKKNRLDLLEPSAYEGVARAHAVAKNEKKATEFLLKARSLLGKLDLDKGDREVFVGQISDTQKLIDRI